MLKRSTIFTYLVAGTLAISICVIVLHAAVTVYAAGERFEIRIHNYRGKQYVSLHELNRVTSLESTYDFILQRGKIYKGNSYAVYQPGLSVAIIDGSLTQMDYPVERVRGEILLPLGLSRSILSRFYPAYALELKSSHLLMTRLTREISPRDYGSPRDPVHTSRDAIKFIVIDAGHGGKDPGAIGKGNIREKVINLKLSRMLRDELKRKLKDVRIIMTRDNDRFIELGKRTEIANRQLKKGTNGIFVSIHVNASVSHKVSGFETYFLSQNPTNEEARSTAALENNVVILEDEKSRKKYRDADLIEALMITTQIQKESSMLADTVQKDMDKIIWEFKSRGVKKADFFVLRGALMPAVLVEVGYITNRKERGYLLKSSYQKKVARGIASGIIDFIDTYNKEIIRK